MDTPNVLKKIAAYKKNEVLSLKSTTTIDLLRDSAKNISAPKGFLRAIKKSKNRAVIAEIKKASPSKGLIRSDFNPPDLAKSYEAGGATCLSILTDKPSFQGAPEYLIKARAACNLPVLRKDFMYDTYQVAQARAWNADCILIILASVSDMQAQELEACAFEWGMDVLLEVHNMEELDRALMCKSSLLGINNRNLKTFEVTLDTTRTLSKHVPIDRHMVTESGIFTPEDMEQMAGVGARSFLIGESLMRQKDVTEATKSLLKQKRPN